MANIGAAYIDLSRAARAFDGIADQSQHLLSAGKLTNVPRVLKNERFTVHDVLGAARQHPEAFTDATDVVGGTRLLERALTRVDGSMAEINASIAASPKHKNVDIFAASAALRGAADDVREAQRLLGGRRALPPYEQGAPIDRAALPIAASDSPVVVGAGHERFQRGARWALRHGVGQALGTHAVREPTVPARGRVLIAPTHGSGRDPLDVMATVDRPFRAMAKAALSTSPILRPILERAGTFPVQAGDPGPGLAVARTLLATDQAAVIYPEGMLVHGDYLGAHRTGVRQLATEMGAPVVPVASHGNKPGRFRGEGVGRPLVSVVFGEAIQPPTTMSPFNVAVLGERIARAHDELLVAARADYEVRRAVSNSHRPLFYGGLAAATAGAGTATWTVANDQ